MENSTGGRFLFATATVYVDFIKTMDFLRLKYFYNVAKLGSFTAAAREVKVSQPSLSKMVKQLEDQAGVILLERGKKGVEMTPAGRLVYDRCQEIFSQLQSLQTGLSAINEEVTGDLRLGASDNICNYLLPPLLDEILRNFPKLRVKLFSGTSSEIQNELDEGRVEIGLFYSKVTRSRDFHIQPLRFVEFAIVSRQELRLKDLSKMPFIGSRRSDYQGTYPVFEMLRSIGVEPNSLVETNNQETQKRVAVLGMGYTVVPIHMVEKELADRTLIRTFTEKKLGSEMSLVQRRGRNLSKQAEVVISLLLQRFGHALNAH